MTVIDFLNILKKHVVLIATLSILGMAFMGIRAHFFIEKTYYSTAQVTMKSISSNPKIADDISKVATYKKLGKSKSVIKELRKDLKTKYNIKMSNKEIKSSYNIGSDPTTLVMDIGSNAHDAKEAQKIANTAANAFVDKMSGFIQNTKLIVTDDAVSSDNPAYPNVKASVVKGLLVGLFISICSIILIEQKNKTNN